MGYRLTCVCLLLAPLLCLLGGCDKYAQDKEDIRAALDANKRAMQARDAQGFIDSVSEGTLENLDRVLRLAREGSRIEVQSKSVADKMLIVMLRNRVPRDQLRKLDSKAFIVWSMEQGWWDSMGDREESIESIKVVATTATVKMRVEGSDLAREVGLVKEDKGWRLDMSVGQRQLNRRFEEATNQFRLDENQTILRIEAMSSGREPARDIWDAPK